jgi:hypothetical protein
MPAWLWNARVRNWLEWAAIFALIIAGIAASEALDRLFGNRWWFLVAFGGFLAVWLLWLAASFLRRRVD